MSTSAAIRAQAARALASVLQGRSLDAALEIEREATAQERGLLRSLCFDSVRWYVRLHALLDRLLSRPGQSLDREVHALAIVGLCQLFYTQIPPHAAVAETVNAARLLGRARAAGFINAVLRRCLRERETLAAAVDADLATRTAHPDWLLRRFEQDWPEQYLQILEANNQRPPFWIRVNRAKVDAAKYREELQARGIAVAASLFEGEALRLEQPVEVGALPGFAAGLVSVQDAAAQLAARLLHARAGERVLDACAAPGGKTGHILELEPKLAELVAVDESPERLTRVADNLQRLGLHAKLLAADVADRSWWNGERFQRILLDVPCSATGVIRRHPDIKLLRRETDIEALARKQAHLLEQTWSMLADGGRLLYASCSALRAETTDVVAAFLATRREARDVTEATIARFGLEPQPGPGYRIAAGTAGMDGFYYACLERGR